MRKTQSWIRQDNQNIGLLNGGDFGFDLSNGKLLAGFGNRNIEIITKQNDSGWLPLMLQNEWEIEGEAPAYRVDASGVIHVKGTVRNGNLNHAVAQLPIKPSRNISKIVPMRDGIGRLDINTQGYIIPRGSNQYEIDETTGEDGTLIEVSFLNLEVSFIP